MSDRNSGNFFTGLLIGAVFVLFIGFLFAPRTGEETRQIIKEKVVVARDKADEVVQKIKKASSDIRAKTQSETE